MVQLVSFSSNAGPPLLVEVSDDSPGLERVAREDGGVVQASETLEQALTRSMPTLRTIIHSVRALAPDQAQVEFGITLSAEAGVVVAKTAVEGHFTVTLSWSGAAGGA